METTRYLSITQTYDAATWIVYQFSTNKNWCWFQEVVLSFAMTNVHIEQPYDMLLADLFNNIYQKSNNEKTHTDLTFFLMINNWYNLFCSVKTHSNLVELYIIVSN